ncbi:hypothetical protein [Chlamydia sp. 17-3921]|uniref:hypothetical protein n=1 Tax=Chlamydia sp. 17-3921 TaxID=2675798 RepID=UPI0019185229|nr:hypothetical protein [Chlamydia sp. 17-3921]
MVNPLGSGDPEISSITNPSSQETGATGSTSTEGVSKTEKPQEAPSSSEVGLWRLLGAARRTLSEFVNKITSSSPTSETQPEIITFEDYKTQAETAYNTFLSSTDYTTVQTSVESLQKAIAEMNNVASSEEEKALAAEWAEKNTKVNQVNTQLKELSKLETETTTFVNTIAKLDTIDLVQASRLKSEENVVTAENLLQQLQTEPPLGSVPGVAQILRDNVKTEAEKAKTIADDIIQAHTIGEYAYGSVQIAKENNSQQNIDATTDAIAAAEQALADALNKYPDSPVLQNELTRVQTAKTEVQNIEPAGSSSVGGGGSSTGSAQHHSFTVGNVRVALLLDDAESESVSILLDSFRSMIDLFRSGSSGVGELEDPVQGQGADDQTTNANQALLTETQKVLGTAQNREGLINALGQIASQAMVSAGTPEPVAKSISKSVKQLYKSSKTKDTKALSSGYDAFKTLTESFNRVNSRSKETLNSATRSALSQPIPRSDVRQRETDSSSQRVAKMIADGSTSLRDVYVRLGSVESIAEFLQSNPNALDQEVKEKLVTEISKLSKLGYPHIQLPSESTQQFLSRLSQEFTERTKLAAELKLLSFDTRSQFIQQVLVNLGSLFSAYLQ